MKWKKKESRGKRRIEPPFESAFIGFLFSRGVLCCSFSLQYIAFASNLVWLQFTEIRSIIVFASLRMDVCASGSHYFIEFVCCFFFVPSMTMACSLSTRIAVEWTSNMTQWAHIRPYYYYYNLWCCSVASPLCSVCIWSAIVALTQASEQWTANPHLNVA